MRDILLPGVVYRGRISSFGGPDDPGVSETEGLALYERGQVSERPDLFLSLSMSDNPPPGLARRLNPQGFYCAMRWNYKATPKHVLRRAEVEIRSLDGRLVAWASPVDWGPRPDTGRLIDVSPQIMSFLNAETDDEAIAILHLNHRDLTRN